MDLVFTPSQIETWPIERLRSYARKAKIHGSDQVAKIAASMARFGWTVPCMVAEDGELIAGHGRVLAATMLGLKDVPVIRLGHLDEAERRAYRIADNKLTELGEWDEAMLRDEIAGLLAEDFDLALLGMSDEDLDALLRDPDDVGGDGPVEGEDDLPEPPVTPVSVAGELWQLGSHRLICGDSTSADVVGRLLGDVKPLLMVTDPPYGVEYDPSWRNQAGAAKTKRTGKVLNDDRADWREAWALFPGDVAYVWHGALHAATVAESLVAAGFMVRSQIIWAKDRLVLSRGDYHWQHEPCWYAVRKTGKGHWAGDRKQTTLWQIANKDQDAETVHGTQKPVECMRRPILNNSSPGQAVFEPFMGSGTTLIAAETTGRVCFGVELNPVYVDVAIVRWQSFTGETAKLAESGAQCGALAIRDVDQGPGAPACWRVARLDPAEGYSAYSVLSRGPIYNARKTGRLVICGDGSINATASDARGAEVTDPDRQRQSTGRRRKLRPLASRGLKPVPSEPHRLVFDLATPLVRSIFDVSKLRG